MSTANAFIPIPPGSPSDGTRRHLLEVGAVTGAAGGACGITTDPFVPRLEFQVEIPAYHVIDPCRWCGGPLLAVVDLAATGIATAGGSGARGGRLCYCLTWLT